MQVFAVALDYCKALERRPFKQKAAGKPPPLVLSLQRRLLTGRRTL